MLTVTAEYLAEQGLSPTFPVRFWAKVDKNGPVPSHRPELGPCWVWKAMLCKHGRYGGIAAKWNRDTWKTEMIYAHRASWILHCGPIPDGMEVCHHCDFGPCVRPDHLWLGTHEQNMNDCRDKGRGRGLPGELHNMAKLTAQHVQEIRALYSPVLRNGEVLARRFGVTRQQIWHIVKGQHWAIK